MNDPYVVTHFAKKLDYEDRLNFIADWDGRLNDVIDCRQNFELELGNRNHRYTSFILYGTLQIILTSEWENMFFTKCIHPIFMWQKMQHRRQRVLFFC